MANEKGWVKIYRDIQDNELWKSDEPFDKRAAWIDLISMANHKDNEIVFNGNAVVVKKGQLITSELKLAKKWHWSKDKVRRYLSLLKRLGMITKECTTKCTTITLVNYSKFQGERTTDNTTNKTRHKTADNTADDTQTRMIKNDKENKEGDAPLYSSDPERNAEIIDALNRGAVLNEDGSLDYSNVKSSWE